MTLCMYTLYIASVLYTCISVYVYNFDVFQVFPENGLNKESVGEGPVIDVPMTPSDDPGSVSVETALSSLHSPPTPISTSSSSSVLSTTTEVPCSFNSDPCIHEECDVHVFVWKSPRRRLAPERFTSSDFRESKGRQGVKSRRNSCQGASERVEYCEKERLLKREELEALRRRQLDTFRCVCVCECVCGVCVCLCACTCDTCYTCVIVEVHLSSILPDYFVVRMQCTRALKLLFVVAVVRHLRA